MILSYIVLNNSHFFTAIIHQKKLTVRFPQKHNTSFKIYLFLILNLYNLIKALIA